MKRKILYLGALLCVMSVFVSCEKDPEPSHKWAKTYALADYKVEETEFEGEKFNNCVQGAGYINYACISPDLGDIGTGYGGIFRAIFGAILPQVLKSVTLEKDGNITAEYIGGTPNIVFDSMWAFMAPDVKTIEKLIPAGGWIKSPKGFATWSEKGGKVLLKLNINKILADQGITDPNMIKMITDLLKSEPAALKAMLAEMGLNLDVSDESIKMLLGWVNDGILLNYKETGSRVSIYLDKTSFDPLFKMRTNDKSDIMVIWDTLAEAGILPEEAATAAGFVYGISQNWASATAFDLGLDLQQLAK